MAKQDKLILYVLILVQCFLRNSVNTTQFVSKWGENRWKWTTCQRLMRNKWVALALQAEPTDWWNKNLPYLVLFPPHSVLRVRLRERHELLFPWREFPIHLCRTSFLILNLHYQSAIWKINMYIYLHFLCPQIIPQKAYEINKQREKHEAFLCKCKTKF